MSKEKLNTLPVPTFRWLGVNDAELDIKEYETDSHEITAASCEHKSKVIYIDGEGKTQVNIKAGNSASAKVALVYDVKGKAYSCVKAEVGENASLELIELFLGGDVVSETVTELNGRKSVFNADIGYLLDSGDKLDINLLANHYGRRSVSKINTGGVLGGDSEKVFKGTIDFKKGADGAVGSEKEDTLLMSDDAVSKTAPLILCAEENVEGTHGASIGRLDEKQVFYMQSRGIDIDRIYELAAQAKLRQILSKIDDAATVKRINKRLGRGEDDE